jgi:drug/metabolite transporter (DMT)-like permease
MTQKSHDGYGYGVAITLSGVLLLSPDGLLIRLMSANVWTQLFWRGCLPAFSLFLFLCFVYRRKTFSQFSGMGKAGLLSSFFVTLSTLCFVYAISVSGVASTLVLVSSSPLLAALLSRFLLKENISRGTWSAILFGFVGVCIVLIPQGQGGEWGGGNFCALGAAFFTAANFVLIRSRRKLDFIPSLALGWFWVSMVVAPFAPTWSLSPQDWYYMSLLGFLILPLSLALINTGPRYLQAPEVGLITLLETLLGPLWVWFILDEAPSLAVWIGGSLLLLALVGHLWILLKQKH